MLLGDFGRSQYWGQFFAPTSLGSGEQMDGIELPHLSVELITLTVEL